MNINNKNTYPELILDKDDLVESDYQKFKTLVWFLGPGPRGTGRTHILALAYIQLGLLYGPNYTQAIKDHGHHRDSVFEVRKELDQLCNKLYKSMEEDEDCPYLIDWSAEVTLHDRQGTFRIKLVHKKKGEMENYNSDLDIEK